MKGAYFEELPICIGIWQPVFGITYTLQDVHV